MAHNNKCTRMQVPAQSSLSTEGADAGITRRTPPPPPRRIVLAASKLAACAGLHPYQSRQDMVHQFSQRYAPHLVDRAYVPTHTQARRALAALPAEQQAAVAQAVSAARAAPDNAAVNAVLAAVDVDVGLPAEVRDLVRSTAATELGTRAEAGVRDAYGASHATVVTGEGEYVETAEPWFTVGGVRVHLGGKHDGMSGDGTLIEVKNRMRRFLGVPRYERVQIMAYMRIFQVDRARLVERLGAETREHDVVYDRELWEDLESRARAFVEEAVLLQVTQGSTST